MTLRARALFLTLITSAAAAQAGTSPDRAGAASWVENLNGSASAAASWVENASRTSFTPTRKDAALYEFNLGVSQHRQLAPDWQLNAGADAAYTAEPEFDRNSNFKFGPRFGVQRKFGLGPMAPVLLFAAAATYKVARIPADTGWTADAGLQLSQRLTPEFRVAARGEWQEHYARSATFDIQQRTLSVEAVWDINEKWQLSGSAGRLHGRVVANAAWSVWQQAITGGLGPTVSNYYNSIPWQVTDSYGPGWVSYRVDAKIDLASLTLAYTLTERTTLEASYRSAYVVNQINIRYPTESWGLGVLHRF